MAPISLPDAIDTPALSQREQSNSEKADFLVQRLESLKKQIDSLRQELSLSGTTSDSEVLKIPNNLRRKKLAQLSALYDAQIAISEELFTMHSCMLNS